MKKTFIALTGDFTLAQKEAGSGLHLIPMVMPGSYLIPHWKLSLGGEEILTVFLLGKLGWPLLSLQNTEYAFLIIPLLNYAVL